VHIYYQTYGCIYFDHEKYLSAYDEHEQKVRNHLSSCEDDLLVLNICSRESYEEICNFLNKFTPSVSFPKSNST
jgi:hypothetical protein